MSPKVSEKADSVTAVIKKAIDVLFILNPAATGMGAVFGGSLYLFAMLFDPVLIRNGLSSVSKINPLWSVCFGVFGFNLPSYLKNVRGVRSGHGPARWYTSKRRNGLWRGHYVSSFLEPFTM